MTAVLSTIRRVRRALIRTQTQAHLLGQRHFGKTCFIHINKCGGTSVEKALKLPLIHDTAVQRINKIGRARWDKMLSFALVRHPYAKVVSHYKYRVKTRQSGLDQQPIDLEHWIIKAYGERDPLYYNNPLMFQPCLDWLVDADNKMLVTRILKLEDIDTEWKPFCEEAFGRYIPLPHRNATHSATSHPSNHLGTEAKSVLQAHFAKDFEYFGYAP